MRRIAVILVGLAGAAPACAEEGSPWLQIEIPIETQLDAVVSPHAAKLNDLYVTVEPSVSIRPADWLAFEFGLTFEPVADATGDRAYEDHGLYLGSAEVGASLGPAILYAGKFSPHFSIGFEFTPGLNGDTFNADTEISERVGFRGSYNLTGEGAVEGVVVSAALFRRDTTVFSGSAFRERGQRDVADGGPGNHDGLASFTLALDVIEPSWAPGLHAHLGYLQQQAGLGDAADAKGWVAGVFWTFDELEDGAYQILAELARSEDAIGFSDAISVQDASQTLLTLAAGGTWADQWTASVAFGLRETDDPVGGQGSERFLQLSAGYVVSEELSVELGWQRFDSGAETSDTISFRVASAVGYALE